MLLTFNSLWNLWCLSCNLGIIFEYLRWAWVTHGMNFSLLLTCSGGIYFYLETKESSCGISRSWKKNKKNWGWYICMLNICFKWMFMGVFLSFLFAFFKNKVNYCCCVGKKTTIFWFSRISWLILPKGLELFTSKRHLNWFLNYTFLKVPVCDSGRAGVFTSDTRSNFKAFLKLC